MSERQSEFLTLAEVAKILGVSTVSLTLWIKNKKLKVPVYRTPGGHVRFRREDVEKIFEKAEPQGG